jgi:hypothetical protein
LIRARSFFPGFSSSPDAQKPILDKVTRRRITTMRRIIVIALVALAPALVSAPAGARSDAESFIEQSATALETDLVSPPRVNGLDGVAAFTEYSGDPLRLIVWPNDTRRYSTDGDQIGVYLCTWAGATGGIDRISAATLLNSEVSPFYEGLSDGVYSPSFVSRTTLIIDSPNSYDDCAAAMIAEAGAHSWNDEGALGILDNSGNSGKATPGTYCNNCTTLATSTFPANQRWAVIEGESVKNFWGFDPHLTTAAHEIGHMISFPHSYSGEVLYDGSGKAYIDEYDNPIDYMSGNDPASLIGRRVEYPYSTLAFNRYRAGWVDPSDVVFFAGGVVNLTIAPVGVDGTQMVILPTGYQYSMLSLDARISSDLDPIPANFEGISAHYIEQWWRDPDDGLVKPIGGAESRVYTYPPSPYSLDHVTPVGEQAQFNLDQGEALLAQGSMMKVLGQTTDGFQVRLIGFDDIADTIFLNDILWLAESGITKGCSDTSFCPTDYVTRGQMAAFLVRALGYPDDGGGNLFTDDDGNLFEGAIDRLAAAGVTRGCNPPANDQFCPNRYVTREQMAAFLVRALGYTDVDPNVQFTDIDGSVFTDAINKLATAGVTKGCNPPENDRFCPTGRVTRAQMAAFLERALG